MSARPLIAVPVLLTGAAVAVSLGMLGTYYWPGTNPLPTWGFSGPEAFKAYLSSLVLLLICGQLLTAVWIYRWRAGRVVHLYHRLAGTVAFALSLPVAFYCLYTFGFRFGANAETRTIVHSIAGCVFYGAFASKMLTLRLRNTPGWLLPVLGGLVFGSFVLAWALASFWWFDNFGFGR
ncbi:DUF6529 family protein [Nocardia sp. NPDC052566]|uniref:DUF6529 family protein n=1 Tax=Nocardia sp. NPDC052566 TaxID=3364330 RepID=UPI0037CC7265